MNNPRFWYGAVLVFGLSLLVDGALSPPKAGAAAKTAHAAEGTDAAESDENGHAEESSGHENHVSPVLAAIILILLLAKMGGDIFERVGMPAVLGELTVGIVLGNMAFLTGWEGLDALFKIPEFQSADFKKAFLHDPEHVMYNTPIILKILAEIGVILLLFEVGLESTVKQMLSVGTSSLLVAILGVIAPMALGWGVGWLLIRESGWQVHSFLGATLCATSVGITARVLKDLGRSQQRESQIILGAAVIDDILGLIVLTVVTGVIQSGDVSVVAIGRTIGYSIGFLVAAIVLGTFVFARPLLRTASFLRGHGLLVAAALVICFGFSWLASLVQLAPIVGAFAAGLILEKTHYRELNKREDHDLEEALAPLTALLVPIFFVQMGTQVDLSSFADSKVWVLAGALTAVAIVGKQVCSFGVLEKGLNKPAVGLGMIPRGEVGLIFAGVGQSLKTPEGDPVIRPSTFSAVIVMVMITTMVTPPLLKWVMIRKAEDESKPPDGGLDPVPEE